MENTKNDDHKFGFLVEAVNIGLFGNLDDSGESSLSYFFNNKNITLSGHEFDTIIRICNTLGLKIQSEQKIPLNKLYMRYYGTGGRLKQIFIKNPDDVVYLSRKLGIPFGSQNTKSKEDFEKTLITELDLEKKTAPSPIKVLTLLRNNPTNKIFSDFADGGFHMQARILHLNKMFFEPNDKVKTIYYTTTPEAALTAKELRKELDNLVKEIIWENLKSGSIKEEDVKLKKLYSAMQPPTKKEDLK